MCVTLEALFRTSPCLVPHGQREGHITHPWLPGSGAETQRQLCLTLNPRVPMAFFRIRGSAGEVGEAWRLQSWGSCGPPGFPLRSLLSSV